MNYHEAIDSIVTKKEAAAEIRAHGLNPSEFFGEMPANAANEYEGADVLSWLGY